MKEISWLSQTKPEHDVGFRLGWIRALTFSLYASPSSVILCVDFLTLAGFLHGVKMGIAIPALILFRHRQSL